MPTFKNVLPNLKGGEKRLDYGGICLEAQIEPNSVNNGIGIYEPYQVYAQTTVYELEVNKQ